MIDPALVESLRADRPTIWLRPEGRDGASADAISAAEIEEVEARLERFRPVLAALFPGGGWDGRVASALDDWATGGLPPLLVKRDDALPMTGSVKARGGVYELLCAVERFATEAGMLDDADHRSLLAPPAREALARRRVLVASTGNLGFSVGLVARAFGVPVEVHMSHDAKAWKKDRLRAIGAAVVEHACDYHGAVARARTAAAEAGAHFVDDENSPTLFAGYAAAANEVAGQLAGRGIVPCPDHPLVAYLPCGVGGAPGGILAGLKRRYGDHAVVGVLVEPTASPCVLAALASGGEPVSVYDLGLTNDTVADGLAVPLASRLVLDRVGEKVDAAVAVPDRAMLAWVRRAWAEKGWRLEPSAAAALAAVEPFLAAPGRDPARAHHLAWTTGGRLLPDAEFARYLA